MATEYEIKKQICEIGKRIYDRGMVASNDGNISVKISDNEFLCTPTGAVSYTHLDVYKRQSYEREEYTKPFGIIPEEGKTVICARYPDRFVGLAYVSIDGELATVHEFSLVDGYDDDTDFFLLGKAMLNYLDLHGAKNVVLPLAKDEKILKMCIRDRLTTTFMTLSANMQLKR